VVDGGPHRSVMRGFGLNICRRSILPLSGCSAPFEITGQLDDRRSSWRPNVLELETVRESNPPRKGIIDPRSSVTKGTW
jgi:hypothetical protein